MLCSRSREAAVRASTSPLESGSVCQIKRCSLYFVRCGRLSMRREGEMPNSRPEPSAPAASTSWRRREPRFASRGRLQPHTMQDICKEAA